MAEGVGVLGVFRVEWDEDDRLVSEWCKADDPEKPRGECRHLGVQIGEADCPACRGTVRLKVLGCMIHQRCTLAKQIEDLACCTVCKDHAGKDS